MAMPMTVLTYRQLLARLLKLNEEHLDDHITIQLYDEFWTVNSITIQDEDDVLDAGHLYLECNSEFDEQCQED